MKIKFDDRTYRNNLKKGKCDKEVKPTQSKIAFFNCFSIKCFFFTLCLLCLELAAETLDVETLAQLRTRQYSKQPYDKIVVFSAPRTGSSLIFNVFRFLFEEEDCLGFPHNKFYLNRSVLRTHKVSEIKHMMEKEKNVLYIVTLRDPLQTILSTCRIRSKPIKDMQTFCRKIISKLVEVFTVIKDLENAGLSVVVLKFEEIEKRQCDYLIEFIESHFHLSIEEKDVQTLKAGYSRENIYANICSLRDFEQFLPISGFHGKHISLKPFMANEKLLYWFDYYYSAVKPFFQQYGY